MGLPVYAIGKSSGGESGGGSDLKDMTSGSSWFLGQGEIRFCLESVKAFPIEQAKAQESFLWAAEKWKSYLEERDYGEKEMPEVPKINLNYRPLASCDGTEDVKIFLGKVDSAIEKEKAKYENPVAFAKREEYDSETGKTKGYLWLNKNIEWTRAGALDGIMLHEMGHMIGIGHIEGTIMEEGIAWKLLLPGTDQSWEARTIDRWSSILLFPRAGKSVSIQGKIPVSRDGDLDQRKIFQRIAGRKNQGDVAASVVMSVNGKFDPRFKLSLADKDGSESFDISILPGSFSVFHLNSKILGIVYSKDKNSRSGTYSAVEGFKALGKLITKQGEPLLVQVSMNHAYAILEMKLVNSDFTIWKIFESRSSN